MYELIRSASIRSLLGTQALPFLIAFTIAALFFKWKSFALECLGFLALWFVLDAAYAALRGMRTRQSRADLG